jgi:hypothetical protein
MASIQLSKAIAADPARVFALASDLPNAPKFIPGIKRMEMLTSGPVGKGTKFRETRIMFGKEATETMEMIEFEPGKSYSIGCESCGVRYLTRMDFKPEGAWTRVEMHTSITPVSLMAKLMSPLSVVMKGMMRKALDGDLESLKKAAEGGVA